MSMRCLRSTFLHALDSKTTNPQSEVNKQDLATDSAIQHSRPPTDSKNEEQHSGRTTEQNAACTMDSELAGTTRWIVIPTGRHRDHYELPLWMFRVATDVLQDVNYYPPGLEAVREGILLRLSERQDYEAESDFISLQFLADLRSSLNHPDDRRRPWPYNRPDDESEDETSLGESDEQSSSEDAQMGPTTQRPYQNQTSPEMHEQQENPDEEMHGWVSDVSTTSSYSTREITAPNEPGTASPSSSSDTIDIPDDVASSDSETEDRHFKFLQATFQFSQLQLEQLQLLSKSRQHQNAARKARKESRRTAQMDKKMPDADENSGGPANPEEYSETLVREELAHEAQTYEYPMEDDLQ